ncbi:hypothetical protein WUBG_11807, partial [Wuchereria bancrofti]
AVDNISGVTQLQLGFEYKWMSYKEVKGGAGAFKPLHVGDCVPCVLKTAKGAELLGNLHMKMEKATAGFGGKDSAVVGPAVMDFLVLCRNGHK